MTENSEKSPFVTIESLAQYFCVSVSTIRAWVRQGYIPENTYIKIGNTYRFNREQVADALMEMQEYREQPKDAVVEVTGVQGSVLSMGETMADEEQLEFNFDADEDA